MAVLLSGALLVRHAPAPVADAYVASRVGGEGGYAFGTLPRGVDVDAVLERLPRTSP
jgi:putative acyl-CoA dehydrogenase